MGILKTNIKAILNIVNKGDDMQEKIELRDYIEILYSRKRTILVMTLIALVASFVLSFFVLEPEYEASTLLMVKRPAAQQDEPYYEYDDIIINQKLVNTYEKIILSKTVLRKVMANLNINMGIREFRKLVSVNLLEQTEMMEIVVDNGSPQLAANIANNISLVFAQEVSRIMGIQNINVIDAAEVPLEPANPKRALIILFATFMGLIGGMFIAILSDYLDNTIKTPNDVEKHLGIQVIGVVPFEEENKEWQ